MSAARHLLSLLLAVLLVAGQWAGTLHGLAHAAHELAVAKAAIGGGEPAAPLDHARDHCVAFQALDGSAVAASPGCLPPAIAIAHAGPVALPWQAAQAFPFRSRAPPRLS